MDGNKTDSSGCYVPLNVWVSLT